MSVSTETQVQRGMIVELDYTALPGHQLLLETCQEQFVQAGLKFDAALMARCMGGKSFSAGLSVLATHQEKKVDAAALIAACNTAFSAALTQSLAQAHAGVIKLVHAVLDKGVKVIVISRANADEVKKLFADKYGDQLVFQTDTSSGFGFLGWDVWRRAARKNDLRERLCVAVVGSGFSVKGALTSSMSVISKATPSSMWQDFSGSDLCVNEFSAALASDVLRMLNI